MNRTPALSSRSVGFQPTRQPTTPASQSASCTLYLPSQKTAQPNLHTACTCTRQLLSCHSLVLLLPADACLVPRPWQVGHTIKPVPWQRRHLHQTAGRHAHGQQWTKAKSSWAAGGNCKCLSGRGSPAAARVHSSRTTAGQCKCGILLLRRLTHQCLVRSTERS